MWKYTVTMFQPGQLAVAIGRARSLSGHHVTNFQADNIGSPSKEILTQINTMCSVKIDPYLECCHESPFNLLSSIVYNDLEIELDENSDCLDTNDEVQLNNQIDPSCSQVHQAQTLLTKLLYNSPSTKNQRLYNDKVRGIFSHQHLEDMQSGYAEIERILVR